MNSRFSLVFSLVLFFAVSFASGAQTPDLVIPAPAEIIINEGMYAFEGQPKVKEVHLKAGKVPAEGYILEITRKGVVIKSSDDAGAFYARQTLDQMTRGGMVNELQCCKITDSPRFPYRGVHFDVSRHFRSLDFLKKQVDAMAMFKMNRMHIHLTDAAGWRMQIDAYPRLTEFAAWRTEPLWKDWWQGGRLYAEEGSADAYGGYYTKDEMRELVAYAHERHIEVIPEIEMPGHSEEVIAAYPELSCNGQPYSQGEFCVGNDETFAFLETVLMEVMEVFPSEFIHIGGDEASKKRWESCPKCQQRMKDEGLKDVDELQSYLIKRISRFVESKGRRIIGWDEILDGGLASGATVMSWRGTQGGIDAMTMGHDVIMTPGRYCYLDHSQDAPFKEPESIGGYLPLDSVYVYDPVEKTMPAESLDHLLGIQANLWTEYIAEDSHAEYMYWPRTIAIAETGWTRPEKKDLKDFRRRVSEMSGRMKEMGYTVFDLSTEYGERKQAQTGLDHMAKGCKVSYGIPASSSYKAAGETTLTDGVIGGWTYSDKRWQGFLSDMDVTIDLGSVKPIHYIGGTFMQLTGPEVFMPEKVDVYVSVDGQEFTHVAEIWNDISVKNSDLLFRNFDTVCNQEARYVRYQARRAVKTGWLFIDEIVIN